MGNRVGSIDLEYLRDLARAHDTQVSTPCSRDARPTTNRGLRRFAHERIKFMIAHQPAVTAPTIAARECATLDHNWTITRVVTGYECTPLPVSARGPRTASLDRQERTLRPDAHVEKKSDKAKARKPASACRPCRRDTTRLSFGYLTPNPSSPRRHLDSRRVEENETQRTIQTSRARSFALEVGKLTGRARPTLISQRTCGRVRWESAAAACYWLACFWFRLVTTLLAVLPTAVVQVAVNLAVNRTLPLGRRRRLRTQGETRHALQSRRHWAK